jgi:hypothetical protein
MSCPLTQNLVLQKTKLHELRHVRKLNVCGVQIDDIRVLRETPNVEVLSLSVNEIECLDPLSQLYNLRELYLRRNAINDVRQILHLSKLPFLSSLNMSDNPVSADPNYRKFAIAAVPPLVKLDDVEVSPRERAEAERAFPGLCDAQPPPPLIPQGSSHFGSPNRPSLSSTVARALQHDDQERLSRRLEELSASYDEQPVGGRRTIKRHEGTHHPSAAAAAVQREPQPRNPAAGPREEGVILAIKTLLNELSPAGVHEVQRFIESL